MEKHIKFRRYLNLNIGVEYLICVLLRINCKATNLIGGEVLTPLERGKHVVHPYFIQMSGA